MRITGLGHASVLIETAHGTVLTDPWVNPAYFGSWFPFPDNSQLDWDRLGQVDYLFVSHLHRDHFDPEHLRKHVSKRATVLLPEYPTSELEDALREVGFSSFVQPVSGEPTQVDGLQVMVQALTSPTDWPIGDSSLWLYDGVNRVLNQNDARPADLEAFSAGAAGSRRLRSFLRCPLPAGGTPGAYVRTATSARRCCGASRSIGTKAIRCR